MERIWRLWRSLRSGRSRKRRTRLGRPRHVEGLEGRALLSALGTSPIRPAVEVLSASPTGGQGVRVAYRVDGTFPPRADVGFAVYRSADATFDPGDSLVARVSAETDDLTPGEHTKILAVPGGLTPVPARPYVIAAEEDGDAIASRAAFRVYSLAVVTHGGNQNQGWKNGPPWVLVMAKTLEAQGYDRAIPFNWVSESDNPGAAASQGRRLARVIRDAVGTFPDGAPIDLHLIGHSEGAVVVTQALQALGPDLTPGLAAGYLQVTLLDPHAANNAIPGQNASISDGPLGWLAKNLIDSFKADAKDPPVVLPGWVDGHQVFYQQTPASRDHGTNDHIYNLWGQVPVRGATVYFDLTPASVTHGGKTGVAEWYQRRIVPTLGEGSPEVAAAVLTADATAETLGRGSAVRAVGKAEPGGKVRVLAATLDDHDALSPILTATADADGAWSGESRPLPAGPLRLVARAIPPTGPARMRLPMVSTALLGELDLPRLGRSRA